MTSWSEHASWGLREPSRRAVRRVGHGGFGVSQLFRTGLLMAGLVALLAWVGQFAGGVHGMIVLGAAGVLFNLGAWWFSDRLALAVHGAQPADPLRHRVLFALVEELSRRADIPLPRVYVIPTRTPNAFATGRSPSHAAVAVTEGLLQVLDVRELRGVLAHELAHVRNRDTLIATITSSIAGLISSIGNALQWGLMLGLGGARGDTGEERGRGGLEVLVLAIVAPIVAMLVQLGVSRTREYAADATGARISGDPDALADALVRLERGNEAIPYANAGAATAHLFIVSPFAGRAISALLSTHPPTEERVRRLRSLRA